MKNLKITEEQLKNLQTVLGDAQKIEAEIASAHLYIHKLTKAHDDVTSKMDAIKVALEEEYGKININISTGEYTLVEEDKTAELEVV